MSGILDNKSRVMDNIITQEGKKQISQGNFKIAYASFSDGATFYSADLVSGSTDATRRIYFESCHLPQDEITFKADDSGKLLPFKNESELSLKAGQLLSYTFEPTTSQVISGSTESYSTLSGVEFASQISGILTSSFDNFNKLYLLSDHDDFFGDQGFAVGPASVEFIVHDTAPLDDKRKWSVDANKLESLFNDRRLSNLKNFQYLPPVNKIDDESIDKTFHGNTKDYLIGNYPAWGSTDQFDYDSIKSDLSYHENNGYVKSFNFDPTTKQNNLSMQFFELSNDAVKKLDVIDYGKLYNKITKSMAHVFFAGRLIVDDNDTHTFLHMFTMIFE